VTFATCTVQPNAAGNGGQGGDASPGQAGAAGIMPGPRFGTSGGAGGNGAGGSVGLSAGVVYGPLGAPAPAYDATTQFLLPAGLYNAPGAGGQGGPAVAGSANVGPAGPRGFLGPTPIVKVLPPPWNGTGATL
jgi:hypothetical protein